jgi:hypothetical protein
LLYWRDKSFRALKEIAAEAAESPAWADYAAYCTELERGLRRQALSILDRFTSHLENASFEDRKRFVSWLLHRTDVSEAAQSLAPHPLRKRVIEPTLAEWLKLEPSSSEPHRWLGGYEHLKQALLLDASDEIARRRFVACILSRVDDSAHDLPNAYLGKPRDDLTLLAEAEVAAFHLGADARRDAISEIRTLKSIIKTYLRKVSAS